MICKNCKLYKSRDCSIRVMTALLEYLDLCTKIQIYLPHFLFSVQFSYNCKVHYFISVVFYLPIGFLYF